MTVPYDRWPPCEEEEERPKSICRGCQWGRITTQERLKTVDHYLSICGWYHEEFRWTRAQYLQEVNGFCFFVVGHPDRDP